MIRGGICWEGLSTDRACVVVRTYMFNVTPSKPYRPWANGQAERINRSLMESIRCCLKDNRNTMGQHHDISLEYTAKSKS